MAAPPPNPVPVAYQGGTPAVPDWLNKGDNAWQMISATLVGLQSVPGLVILYDVLRSQALPFWGKAGPALGQKYLVNQALLPRRRSFTTTVTLTSMIMPLYPMASMVWFQCVFAAITLTYLPDRCWEDDIKAWMAFVPLWLTFSYTVAHLACLDRDRKKTGRGFPPNNVLLMLAGAGLLWMATSLLVWTWLDVIFFKKPSVIAVQGMITGLVCITPGAGLVQGWAAIVFGVLSGSVPWFTMMIDWNLVVTSIICVAINVVIPLRMTEEQLMIGDDAVHGEEAYALWGDGEKYDSTRHGMYSDDTSHNKASTGLLKDITAKIEDSVPASLTNFGRSCLALAPGEIELKFDRQRGVEVGQWMGLQSYPSSLAKPFNHVNYAVVTAMLLYSASADDLAMTFCFLDFHEINEFPSLMQKPETDLLETGHAAQSKSQYALSSRLPFESIRILDNDSL
ncbi:putative nucleotide binding protein [Hibiscus syriacus]|uniref:Nucleotide binding protein n=1 Tax=Hibiscus syriacus TaxID=106335 RepID=A0A6A2ZWF4_HIBSY|nr:putative nucleotide binding protein [Hibiscus syriacus]